MEGSSTLSISVREHLREGQVIPAHPLALNSARVLDEKRDLILAAAKKYGKTCSMLVTSAEQARQWKEAGALLLVYLSDVEMLHSGFSRAMASIRGG